jgi:hypothetical protein
VPAAATDAVTWEAESSISTSLVVGPAFARIIGTFTARDIEPLFHVVPMIGQRRCGVQLNPLRGEGPEYGFDIVVDPDALASGCGNPGDPVRFVLVDGHDPATGAIVAESARTVTWSPTVIDGIALEFERAAPALLPAAGTGPAADGPSSVSVASVAAAVLALGGAAVTATFLRRRPARDPANY